MERLKKIGWALLCLSFAAVFAWVWGLDLVRDFQHRDDPVSVASDYRLVEGSCKSKLFVISACDLKLRPAAGGETIEQNYFLLGNYGGSSVEILRSRTDPSYVTTSMARDQLWNRAILMAVPMLMFGFGGLVLLKNALTGR